MPIRLQERDLSIFRQIQSCRFLTLKQISIFCFEENAEAAKKRLQKLQQANFVHRHSLGILNPSIYTLNESARSLIGERRRDKRPVPSITLLRHEITVRDFKVGLMRAAKLQSIEVPVFSIKHCELNFRIAGTILRPDGYFEVKTKEQVFRYFIEMDRGTEAHTIIEHRVELYRKLAKSKVYEALPQQKNQPLRFPTFRVLFLLTSDARLHSFLSKLYRNGVRNLVMAGTLKLNLQYPLNFVWHTPQSRQQAGASPENIFGLCSQSEIK
jgi:hypothetical protein